MSSVSGISKLPDTSLRICFEYDSLSSINPVLSQVCRNWKKNEEILADRKWKALKGKCSDYPRMLVRMEKIETKYFSSEGAISCFERLDQRMKRALWLNGASLVEVGILTGLGPDNTISIDTLIKMERGIIGIRNENLERLWMTTLSVVAEEDDPEASSWNAAQIRSWLEVRGNINDERLRYVYLINTNPKIRGLPPELAQFTSISKLLFPGNNIASLPATIGNFPALVSLNFADNKIEKLPRSIGDLFSLKSLNVSGNPLTALPEEMGKLFEHPSFNLVLDRDQFLQFYDQLTRFCPQQAWYITLLTTLLWIFFKLCDLLHWIICCEPIEPIELNDFYTKDQIAALPIRDNCVITIHIERYSLDTFFSERRFRIYYRRSFDS